MNRVIQLLAFTVMAAGGASCALPYDVQNVAATNETTGMESYGDRADDPAIWVDPTESAQSLILGTNKAAGLYVYNLDGDELQRLYVGAVNNVDVRGSLVVASNDGINALSWFLVDNIDRAAPLRHLGDTPVERAEPYGICLGRPAGNTTAAVTYIDGALELWQVREHDSAVPEIRLARTVHFASQLEGCVFDDDQQRLFIGEEDHGIWALDLSQADSQPTEVDSIGNRSGLVADVEGLSLYIGHNNAGYLLASAQEADRFVVYDRAPPHRVVGAFRISGSVDDTVDAVSHTDGLDISSAPLPGYPSGLLVVQDDANPRSGVNQNFKLIDWRNVEKAIAELQVSQRPVE